MFSDIVNDESDHWNPMSQNPVIPEEIQGDLGDDDEEIEENHMAAENDDEEIEESHMAIGDEVVSPSMGNAKRRGRVVLDKVRKQKTKTSLVIQEQLTKIADSASSFT
jgi:hypothetical protein